MFSIDFIIGFGVAATIWTLSFAVRRYLFSRMVRDIETPSFDDPVIADLQQRGERNLTHAKAIDPDWFLPIWTETQNFASAVAAHCYPEHENPIMAPPLSTIAKTASAISDDLAHLLTKNKMGGLLDNSLHSYIKSKDNKLLKSAQKWNKLLRWPIRLLVGGRLTVLTVAGKNLLVRKFQAKAFNHAASHIVNLYTKHKTTQHNHDKTT